MKILFYSDLHLEFGEWYQYVNINEIDADLVVLAGDIDLGMLGLMWALMSISKPVIYVMGNHEFYCQPSMNELWQKARAGMAGTHVHLLENESVLIDDPARPGEHIRFLGATLWTDFCLFGPDAQKESMGTAEVNMNDYQNIRLLQSSPGVLENSKAERITPENILSFHASSRKFLQQQLELSPLSDEKSWSKTVVVTHHAPSALSLEYKAPYFDSDAAYATHLDALAAKADVWIHGHTHISADYQIDGCHVVSNPRGYVGYDVNRQFRPDWVLEI